MIEERKLWLNAVEEFRNNKNAYIPCPKCKIGMLICRDVAFDENDLNKGGERIIECKKCEKFEVVLYSKPPKNWYEKTNI